MSRIVLVLIVNILTACVSGAKKDVPDSGISAFDGVKLGASESTLNSLFEEPARTQSSVVEQREFKIRRYSIKSKAVDAMFAIDSSGNIFGKLLQFSEHQDFSRIDFWKSRGMKFDRAYQCANNSKLLVDTKLNVLAMTSNNSIWIISWCESSFCKDLEKVHSEDCQL